MRPQVLVVEDDPHILSSLAEAIREEGCEVHTAANGYQALAEVARQLPDLIFLDLMVPRMDGWKFIEALRTRLPNGRPPIVLLSAAENLAKQAELLGVPRFLQKPFDLADVARLVHQLCPGDEHPA